MEQQIGKKLMPFKIQQLIDAIIQKKRCNIEDAFLYLYSSNLYKQLTSKDSSLWQYSTASLYDLLKKEKLLEKQNQNTDKKVILFQVFCLENYRDYKDMGADDSLYLFLKHDVFRYLESIFETLHTQGRNYIMEEIDIYLINKEKSKSSM